MILSAAASGDTAHAPDNTLGAPAPGYKKTIVPRTLGHLSRRQRRRFRGEISLWHERVIISVVMSGSSRFSPVFCPPFNPLTSYRHPARYFWTPLFSEASTYF